MALKAMTREEWEARIRASYDHRHGGVRFFEGKTGVVYANWIGANQHIEPLLGVYFTKDDKEIKAGTGWAHD